MSADKRYDSLRWLIERTFPKIYWEVWGTDNKHPPMILQGGLDGWQYPGFGRDLLFQSPEGSHAQVIQHLRNTILRWWARRHPVDAARLWFASRPKP